MNTDRSSTDIVNSLSQRYFGNTRFLKALQIVSWIVTAIFLAALLYSIFQAAVYGNPVPAWAWFAIIVLLAAAIGLAVAYVVYRGVTEQSGPIDLRPSTRVSGELKSTTSRVEADEASSLRVEIKMAQGILRLAGGTADALEASFTYDDADWKEPEVRYEVDAAQGNLAVKQRATHRPAMRQGRAEWDIRLNQDLPTDLYVNFGAGKADLQLSGLTLTRLDVESGVGELTLDLSGEWKRSLEAKVKAGIGDTVLRLPDDVGVRVQSAVSLGSVRPHGLAWDGKAYTNSLYGQAPVTLDITVTGGVGKLSLEQTG
jgi:predicted membrane protein